MAVNLKTETPDATLPSDGFLFGADSQSAAKPSVYPVNSVTDAIVDRIGADPGAQAAIATAIRPKLHLRTRSLFEFIDPVLHTNIQNRTNTVDLTAAIQSALSSGEQLSMPDGAYKITDRLSFGSVPGQILAGAERTKSTFVIDAADCNMSATCFLRWSQVYQGIEDIGFSFVQPNVSDRALCNQYPPVFDLAGRTRSELRRLRIERGWKLMREDLDKNNGGSYFDDIQCGVLAGGIFLDNCRDSVYIDKFHYWPFGITTLTDLYNGVYRDRSHYAFDFGRIDDFHVTDSLSFAGYARFEDKGLGGPFGGLANTRMDIDGGKIIVSAGNVTWDGLQTSSTTTTGAVEVTSGTLILNGPILKLGAGDHSNPYLCKVTGGILQINGGKAELTGLDNTRVALVSGGRCFIDGGFYVQTVLGRTRTVPMFEQTAGIMRIGHVTAEPMVAGSGVFVKFGIDGSNQLISANAHANGWAVEIPSSAPSGEFHLPLTTFTPIMSFDTPGDLSVSYTEQIGWIKRDGPMVEFYLSVIATPTYTTASGNLYVGALPLLPGQNMRLPLAEWANIDLNSTRYALSGAIVSGSPNIRMVQSGDNTALNFVTASNTPTGVAVTIRISGRYRA
jgi:hypothetical protein